VYHKALILPDSDLIKLALTRQVEPFLESLKPILPFLFGAAVKLTGDKVNAQRLIQYGVIQLWQFPTLFRSENGSVWWQIYLKMKQRQQEMAAGKSSLGFQSTGLSLKPEAERLLFSTILQGKSMAQVSWEMNILPSLTKSRIENVLFELYAQANERQVNEVDLLTLKSLFYRLLQLEYPEEQWVDAAIFERLLPEAMLALELYLSKFTVELDQSQHTDLLTALRNVQLPTLSDNPLQIEPLDEKLVVTDKWKLITYQISVVLLSVSVVILLFLLIQNTLRLNAQEENLNLLQKQQDILYQNFQRAEKRSAETDQTMNLIQREKASVYYLKSTDYAPESDVIVFWSKTSNRVFAYLNKLPSPVQGHIYKIWAIQHISSGLPTYKSLGLLPKETKEQTLVSVGRIRNADGFLITEETDPNTTKANLETVICKFPVAF